MRRIYLAGPMSGYPDSNYPAFYQAERTLHNKGFAVLNPARNFHGRDDLEYDTYIREDLKLMSFADDIVFLPGWRASRGCVLELHVAVVLGMTLYEFVRDNFGMLLQKLEPDESLGTIIDAQAERKASTLYANST